MLLPEQLETLRAVVNRIIPPDDYPGGWDAGVGDYLRGQFQRDLKDKVDEYCQGLDALNQEAMALKNVGFAALTPADQDALLSQMEQGKVQTAWPIDAAAFFTMLVEHAMEGFYSDPGNGGNRDEVAWKMIGFEVRG
jgi:hypothetical protein